MIDFVGTAQAGDKVYLAFQSSSTQKITDAFKDTLDTVGQDSIYHIMEQEYGTGYSFLNNSIDDGTDGYPLMHNKFAVVINTTSEYGRVWTGSYNPNAYGTVQSNENAIWVESYELAQIYKNEFMHMYDIGFSTNKNLSYNSAQTVTLPDENKITVYFSPYPLSGAGVYDTDTRYAIMDLIDCAKYSVFFNIFTFTSSERDYIQKKVEEAYDRGVEVKGVVEANQSRTVQSELREYGIDVFLDANAENLHHKFAILDYGSAKPIVMTGSYNWTSSARDTNDENFFVIHSREVAELYWREFQKNYALAAGRSISSLSEASVRNVIAYPSPAKNVDEVTIGYELSPAVTDAGITVYTLSGEIVRSFDLKSGEFYPGTYNEKRWDLQNKSADDVAPGLYIIKVEAETGDGTFFDTGKFAVIR